MTIRSFETLNFIGMMNLIFVFSFVFDVVTMITFCVNHLIKIITIRFIQKERERATKRIIHFPIC